MSESDQDNAEPGAAELDVTELDVTEGAAIEVQPEVSEPTAVDAVAPVMAEAEVTEDGDLAPSVDESAATDEDADAPETAEPVAAMDAANVAVSAADVSAPPSEVVPGRRARRSARRAPDRASDGGAVRSPLDPDTIETQRIDIEQLTTFGKGEADTSAPLDGSGEGEAVPDENAAPSQPVAPEDEEPDPEVTSTGQLESILESLIFASDKPLSMADLRRLVGESNGKRLGEALDGLRARHEDSGVQLVQVAGGWQFRTHPANSHWVVKLIAGKPARLSRAMMETLAIVAYRQPVTRPEIDEIRGVDCGPVLKTLLDRNLIRILGKKEEVGRPLLYGTTVEFLKTFSLKELTELPTLREFHELSSADMERVDSEAPAVEAAPATAADRWAEHIAAGGNAVGAGSNTIAMPERGSLPEIDEKEQDALLAELDQATQDAKRAMTSYEEQAEGGAPEDHEAGGEGAAESSAAQDGPAADDEQPASRESEPEPEL